MSNIKLCMICPHATRVTPKLMVCSRDNVDIIEKAKAGACEFFSNTCLRCTGQHNVAMCPIPPDTSPDQERRKAKQGGCCGSPQENNQE